MNDKTVYYDDKLERIQNRDRKLQNKNRDKMKMIKKEEKRFGKGR